MFAAAITTVLFACSGVCGQRIAMRLGSMFGNFLRLLISSLVLGLIVVLFFRDSIAPATFGWYFVSGLIGFGLGDVALFLAYERIGSRLSVLLTLCLAPVFAITLEWIWLGNTITWQVMLATAAILMGVILALRPGVKNGQSNERRGSFPVGVIAGIVAGFGQGCGAVISRHAENVETEIGVSVNGLSAAFQRVIAGFLVAGIVVLILKWTRGRFRKRDNPEPESRQMGPFWLWLLGSALFGPVIGVSCFQWALESLESGIVLAIVAMTPIVMMPLSAITEKDRPSVLAIIGAVIAVCGGAAIYLVADTG
ncbi:MAG: EamA family transporter [Verrucomicrobiales bacterium]|nr:EamA family transporter [Verrucomicrobiales bacterium]